MSTRSQDAFFHQNILSSRTRLSMSSINPLELNIEPRPPPPSILTIPNETLLHILNFVSHPDVHCAVNYVQYRLNDKEYEVSQMFVLHSVCRHFRSIAT